MNIKTVKIVLEKQDRKESSGSYPMGPFMGQNGLAGHQMRLQNDYNQAYNPYPTSIQSWSQNEMHARIAARVVAALPLATPLKGSPTASPKANDLLNSEVQPQSGPTTSRLPSALGSALSIGTVSFSSDKFLTAEFADHAQQLRGRLSPLASSEPAGLSATTATSATTAYTEANPFSPPEDFAFLGHAATAPSSPTGMKFSVIAEGGWRGNTVERLRKMG
ncbi:hypothetical protein QFC21_004789 [Naganishia friedmannii]|uniref:Uncharacterized protein n=1 Tax=Naganishia friedmannii TaxID=89922 RepID=A0ACC2VGL9_9TREE|nr:hypothetical protein QFC21_004789 [Naganishia friedmannii]